MIERNYKFIEREYKLIDLLIAPVLETADAAFVLLVGDGRIRLGLPSLTL